MLRTIAVSASIAAVLGLTGCGVTSQLHSELAFGGVAVEAVAMDIQGVGVLTPSAPTGKKSDKQALGYPRESGIL